ncbi:MAG TPA: DUF4142 domain-containing protein [Fimbriimonadaceae bacterium]|nr:DUF4142 domain-containing protein [Fimbriimonadaceae bacterium]
MKTLIATGVLAALTLTLAAGQVKVTRRLGTTETMNKVRPGMGINSQDRAFFKLALETNLVEIKLGELAQKKGTQTWTREFGRIMVREHTGAFNEEVVIAEKLRLPVSKNLSSASQNMIGRLSRMSGQSFDREFRMMMVNGHNMFLGKIEKEVKSGNNSLIRNHAITLGPVVRLHAKMAERKVTKI